MPAMSSFVSMYAYSKELDSRDLMLRHIQAHYGYFTVFCLIYAYTKVWIWSIACKFFCKISDTVQPPTVFSLPSFIISSLLTF